MRAAVALILALSLVRLPGQQATKAASPVVPWLSEARLGLRVSFGLFALAQEKFAAAARATDPEAVRASARVSAADYAQLTERFEAAAFDAREWVRLAKDAGAEYLVFPAKSRDGFCLYRSAHTEFDVLASAHERDMLRDVARVCRDEGLRLGVAYSLADLHHDDYLPRHAGDPRPATGADFARYVAFARAQVTELCEGYAPTLVQLYGVESSWTPAQARQLMDALRAPPPRLALLCEAPARVFDLVDAITVPVIPSVDAASTPPWVLTYELDDPKADAAVPALFHAVSRGTHLQLHVRANAEGSFSAVTVGRLRVLGEWVRRNGEAIFGAQSLGAPDSHCTWRVRDGNTRLYALVGTEVAGASDEFLLPSLGLEPIGVSVLGGKELTWTQRGDQVAIARRTLGAHAVIAVEFRGLRSGR